MYLKWLYRNLWASQLFVFDAKACREQTRSSDKYFFQMDTPSALGGSAIEKDYSPLYLPNPLPPPASSIFPPFLLPSLPLRFPLQIFPFSSCHCVQFVPEINPSNKGQIMTKGLLLCIYNCVCMCLFFPRISPVQLSSHDFSISSCTSLVSLSFYICVWHSIMFSFRMISFSTFLPVELCFTGSASLHQSVTGRWEGFFLLSFFSPFSLITFHSSSASLFLFCNVSL